MFTEDDMKPDKPRDPPTFKVTSVEAGGEAESEPTEVSLGPRKASKATEYFEKNKIQRIPLIALESDPYKMADQQWCCVSVIRPEDYGSLVQGEKTSKSAYLLKFRGVFPTKELAIAHIEKVMKADPHFDVHLIPAFQWASLEDNDASEREYGTASSAIQEIMKNYFKKENSRVMNFRNRIEETEQSERSENVSDFFNQCNLKTHEEYTPFEYEPATLDKLVQDFQIEPKCEVKKHDPLVDSANSAVISQISLED
jgi:hypothetical protein